MRCDMVHQSTMHSNVVPRWAGPGLAGLGFEKISCVIKPEFNQARVKKMQQTYNGTLEPFQESPLNNLVTLFHPGEIHVMAPRSLTKKVGSFGNPALFDPDPSHS